MMKNFEETIQESVVRLGLKATDMACAITELVDAAVAAGSVAAEQRDALIQGVMKREMSASTVMPDGIALPHGRIEVLERLVCVIGIGPGFDAGAPDNKPTRIVLLLLVPTLVGCNHIHFLAKMSRKLMDPAVCPALLAAQSREDVLKALA